MSASREGGTRSELSPPPEQMMELASRVVRLTAERLEGLADEAARRCAFKSELEPPIGGSPPETGAPPDEVVDRVVRSGFAMMSSTRMNGAYALRSCILNHSMTWDDARSTLQRLEHHGRALGSELGA